MDQETRPRRHQDDACPEVCSLMDRAINKSAEQHIKRRDAAQDCIDSAKPKRPNRARNHDNVVFIALVVFIVACWTAAGVVLYIM